MLQCGMTHPVVLRPIVEYGAEVRYPPLSGGQVLLGKIDKLQVDIIRSAMRCGKENPVVPGLLAEWGVKPLHMWLHQRTMEYYFRVQRMPVSRLPKQVVSAEWRAQGGATLLTGWQKYVHSLLCKYGVNVAVASGSAKDARITSGGRWHPSTLMWRLMLPARNRLLVLTSLTCIKLMLILCVSRHLGHFCVQVVLHVVSSS